ncbi:MAG: hypothetical protein H7330_16855 [Hymenobacteraceae bacterium]|nr:hypothetical protein [Hymenobacteraceae bacterium]
MRYRSTWFFGALLTVSLLASCTSDGGHAAPADRSLPEAYRALLSFLTMPSE